MNDDLPDFGVEHLCDRQPFDNLHGAVARGTQPESGLVSRNQHGWGRRLGKEKAAERQQGFASAVGQPTEVANARKALGQNML